MIVIEMRIQDLVPVVPDLLCEFVACASDRDLVVGYLSGISNAIVPGNGHAYPEHSSGDEADRWGSCDVW